MVIGCCTVHKFPLHFIENLNLLFTHGLAQGVGIAFGETRQLLGQQHHLFLIDRNAVRIRQILFHFGKVVVNVFVAVFSFYVIGNIRHRPWAVECVHGD